MSRERRSQASRLPKTAGFISPSIACESRVAYFCPCDIGVIPHEQRYQALCCYAAFVYLSTSFRTLRYELLFDERSSSAARLITTCERCVCVRVCEA